ncbi:MAG: hypothetical protein EA369_02720 [Bradymonadales bacterium]|nr:MAG: hypothetical protein EA369_02720 [Bradymonadales bacterium]
MAADEEFFDRLVQNRRSLKSFNGNAVSKASVEKILNWATQSPNHLLNQPWRFRVCLQGGIQSFVECLKTRVSESEWKALNSGAQRLLTAGALIIVSVQRGESELRREENFAAAAAATQSLLLGATALGIRSFWSTGKLMRHDETRSLFGIPDEEIFVGGIWLGEGPIPPSPPRRPLEEVSQWFDDFTTPST